MKILRPIKITDAMLTACSIAEDDYPAWSAATTYARGAFVISPATHTVYRSLEASNINHDPDAEQAALADPLVDDPDPVYWQVIGATNRWRLFDGKPSRRATANDAITVEITPGSIISGVAGFEISASSVVVSMAAPDLPRRNLLLYSEILGNGNWLTTRASTLSNAVAAPDGTLTADKLVEDTTATSSHAIRQVVPLESGGGAVTLSTYLKAGERKIARLRLDDNVGFLADVIVDLTSGAKVGGSTLGWAISPEGSGWYRVSITVTTNAAATTASAAIWLYDDAGSRDYTGDGVSGLYIWGTQLEEGSTLTDYQYVNAPSDYDKRVYSRTIAMQDETLVIDWFSYFFEPITELTEFVLTDLPPYTGAVTIEVLRDGGTVSAGQLIVGPIWNVGSTETKGTGFSGVDFSFVEQDEFGDLTTVQRAATRLSTFDVFVKNTGLNGFDARMRSLRGGVAAIWIGTDDPRKAAINYGFYRGYRNAYQSSEYSIMSIEVQGIV